MQDNEPLMRALAKVYFKQNKKKEKKNKNKNKNKK